MHIKKILASSCVFFTLSLPLEAQTKTMENKTLIQTAFDKWADKTGNFFDLLADDVQWTITGSAPLSRTYTGKNEFLAEVIDPLNELLSVRITPQVKHIWADGDMVIVIWDGTAVAKDGKPYNATYEWNMEVKNGKIVSAIAFLDGIEFKDIFDRVWGR